MNKTESSKELLKDIKEKGVRFIRCAPNIPVCILCENLITGKHVTAFYTGPELEKVFVYDLCLKCDAKKNQDKKILDVIEDKITVFNAALPRMKASDLHLSMRDLIGSLKPYSVKKAKASK